MKRKVISLFITIAMVLSIITIPVTAKDYSLVASFNFDNDGYSAGLQAGIGATYIENDFGLWWKNPGTSDYIMKIGAPNAKITISDFISNNNPCGKITFNTPNNGNATFIMMTKDSGFVQDATEIRSGNTALSFKVWLSDNIKLRALCEGKTSDDRELETTLFATASSGNGFANYDYEPGSTTSYEGLPNTNVLKRNDWNAFKFIFDATNGSYDLYTNGRLIRSGIHLAASKMLCNFYIQMFGDNADENTVAYIDDINYYTLSNDDLKAQASYTCGSNGEVIVSNDLTKVGDTVSYVINPNQGFRIDNVKYNDTPVELNGNQFTTPALTAEGGKLSVEFREVRKFEKIFDVDFNGQIAGVPYGKGDNFLTSSNSSSASYQNKSIANSADNKVYANMFAYWGASVDVDELDGDLKAKISIPTVNPNTNVLIYSFIGANDFPDIVKEPFAISYKLKVPAGIKETYSVRDFVTNKSTTISEIKNDQVFLYDYNGNDYTTKTVPGKLNGEEHEYKYVFNPAANSYDFYLDGELKFVNIHPMASKQLFYFCLQIKHNDVSDVVCYFDDFKCFTLRNEDINAQTTVTKLGEGTGKIKSDKTITREGDQVTFTIIPDEDSYIKSINYKGVDIPAFDAAGTTYVTPVLESGAASPLIVEFAKLNPAFGAISTATFKAESITASYIINKLVLNGNTPAEYGMLYSKTNSDLTVNANDTTVIPFSEKLIAAGKGINSNGYYGYQMINNTGADISYYVRAYVKIDTEYYYGDVVTIDTTVTQTVTD